MAAANCLHIPVYTQRREYEKSLNLQIEVDPDLPEYKNLVMAKAIWKKR
jgi:hypothetical protein